MESNNIECMGRFVLSIENSIVIIQEVADNATDRTYIPRAKVICHFPPDVHHTEYWGYDIFEYLPT